jgi:hypothetical protein
LPTFRVAVAHIDLREITVDGDIPEIEVRGVAIQKSHDRLWSHDSVSALPLDPAACASGESVIVSAVSVSV